MHKTKESIAKTLASAGAISQVDLTPTEGEDAFDTLQRIFGVNETARKLFDVATSGDDHEKPRILTLHSSALLAFLCFNDVANHPIKIKGTVYDEVMFEVRNGVITASNPSYVDVLLMGENRKKLLFLESKFTEYLAGGKTVMSARRYKEFYDELAERCTLDFYNKETEPVKKIRLSTGKKTTDYLHGIKQAFSHLLGIATGPARKQAAGNEAYNSSLLDNADEIKFASIVFNCDNGRFKQYYELYKKVFENSDAIKEAIRKVVNKRERNVIIIPELLQYQKVFRNYDLPDKVREFYDQVNDSKIRFSNNI